MRSFWSVVSHPNASENHKAWLMLLTKQTFDTANLSHYYSNKSNELTVLYDFIEEKEGIRQQRIKRIRNEKREK